MVTVAVQILLGLIHLVIQGWNRCIHFWVVSLLSRTTHPMSLHLLQSTYYQHHTCLTPHQWHTCTIITLSFTCHHLHTTLSALFCCFWSQVMCGSLQCADYVTEVPSHMHTVGTILYGSHGTSDETCKYAIVLMDAFWKKSLCLAVQIICIWIIQWWTIWHLACEWWYKVWQGQGKYRNFEQLDRMSMNILFGYMYIQLTLHDQTDLKSNF